MRARDRKVDRRLALRRREPEAAAVGLRDDLARGHVDVCPAPEPHDAPPMPRRDGGDARVVGVRDERASGLQPLENLGLGFGDRVERGEELQVRGRHEQDRRDLRLEGAGEPREVARLREPHLADHPFRVARQVDDRHRESDLAVLVPRRLLDGEAPAPGSPR